jgi:hypothetical protein
MPLTTAQLTTLKAAIAAETDPAFVVARTNGQTSLMAGFFNADSTFIVWRKSVQTAMIGATVNYVAVESMTDINRAKIQPFYTLNPVQFEPTADKRTYWDNTFSGALGGQGQATRDALAALWRRAATRGEKLFATGTGSTASPGTLVFEGTISDADISAALEA